MAPTGPQAGFGPNEWLVDELYDSWLKDPSSVDPAWSEFFKNRSGQSAPDQTTRRQTVATAPDARTSVTTESATATPAAPAKP
ncbi:MAG TPA: hypothetical protein VIP77_07390, partial [Jiangellaceae bacterium]